MRRTTALTLILALTLSIATPAFADFQYTETTKITGGAMSGSMRMLGAFNKDLRDANQPKNTTISVHGNKMRREEADGRVEIWDLDGRQIIHLDTKNKSYTIVTFDEMKAKMEEARRKAEERQSKHKGAAGDPQVKMTPKIKITPGTTTKKLLGYTAKEMKTRIDMEMESTDPRSRGQSGAMWTTADQWVAPVPGYDEMKHFYVRMARELDFMPGAAFGGNVQMSSAMVELQKNSAKLDGMPLLQNTSVGFSGNGQPGQAPQADQSANPLKGLGGMFGRKKKNDDSQPTAEGGSASASGSLMDMTMEVTSVSSNKLSGALFEIPADYKQGKK